MNEARFLTLDEAAQLLAVSKQTIYGWTSGRRIPFRKVGRLLRFDRAELENWTRRGVVGKKNDLDQI